MNYRSILTATVQTIGLFVAGIIPIPLLGQIFMLFTPVPLILIYVRNGKQEGLLSLIASSAVVGLLGGWQAAAILFLSFGLMAVGISEGMRRNLKPEQIALLGGLLPIAVLGIAAGLYLARIGENPVVIVETYLRDSLSETAKLYTRIGLSEMAATVSAVSDTLVHYLARLIPGIAIATSVLQAACCYGIVRTLMMRKPGAGIVPVQPSFAAWYAPDSWVWGLIAALALIVVPLEEARLAGWNLAILFAVVYLSQGTAIVEHYLRKAQVRTFARGLILALILAMPSIAFMIALGIVDIWSDFRKVRMTVPTT